MLLHQSVNIRQFVTSGFILLLFSFTLDDLKAQIPEQSTKDEVALVGATIIDGTGEKPKENGTILIKGKDISCIGDCQVSKNTDVKDVSGKYIMPGLIDLHVHYAFSGWLDSFPGLFGIDVSDKYPYKKVYDNLKNNPDRFHRSHLCSGVTTVFEPGGFPWGFQVEEKTTNSTKSPHYLTAGPILTSMDRIINHPLGKGFSSSMEDHKTVRNAVRMINWQGSNWVKLHRPDLFESKTKRQELVEVASEEVNKADISLIANTPTLDSAKDMLKAGASMFVYPVEDTLVDKEFLRLAKSNNLVYAPAFEAGAGRKEIKARSFDEERLPLDCVDPETRHKAYYTDSLSSSNSDATIIPEQDEKIRNIRVENFKRMHEAGIKVAVGSSSGAPLTFHGPATVNEMKAMEKAGLSPMESIVAATKNGAEALGLNDTGTVQEGKRANLLVLDRNPLEKISNIRQIKYVVKNGKVWQRNLLEYE